MRQDIDGVMTTTEARERGYLPTVEVPALIGIKRDPRELGKTMRREGLRPIRVGHAYWWSIAAVEEWAAQRRWIRPQGSTADPCSAPGCDRDAISHGLCLRHYKAARSKHAGLRRASASQSAQAYTDASTRMPRVGSSAMSAAEPTSASPRTYSWHTA